MRADDRALADLAASVADGNPVDWEAVEAGAPARDRRIVGHLRLVDSIAALHRSISPTDFDTPIAPRATPDGRRWGRLVILEQIGKGTSCDVFRAWDSELHRDVALKLLHEDDAGDGGRDARARLTDEARRLARLRHEHVVQVYGAEEHDGRVGLWTELVRGESLDEIVTARGSLGAREAALVGLDVCAALAAVHGAGLLHRDVKAQNVMRETGGRIVLMDFGTGEDLAAGSSRLVGTPLYLAPEIFGGQKASIQSDVYSVGVMLFYLVTGTFPVVAATMEQLARGHANRLRQPLRDLRPDVPAGFVGVVERALDSDPARRYRSVGELEQGLRESLGRSPAEQPATEPVPARRARRRFGAPFVAAGIALALLVVALIVWTRNSTSVVVPPSVTRVAVLPFRDISSDPTARYLADELTDQLISTLGQIQSLQVPSLTSVLPFRDRSVSMAEIGRQLRVDDIVEATLLVVPGRDGAPDRVRINARLIDAATDSQRWAQQFERSLGDTLALEAEVAQAIAAGISVVLTPAERRRLSRARPTTPGANDAYYQGVHYLSQSSADGRALEAFRRALALDPDHVGAHAGLARGLLAQGFLGAITHQEARSLALFEVNRALELDPDSAEAEAALADLRFYYDWDWVGADRSYRRAIALNPSFARARSQYARYLAAAGRGDEAIAEAVRAAELEPTSASAASTRALMLYYARDYQGALGAIGHALQLESGSAGAYFVLSRIAAARGAIDEAIVANERALAIAGDGASNAWRAHLIRLRALSGDREQARAELARLPAEIAARRQRIGSAQLAWAHEALGERTLAIERIENALSEREPDILWLAVDPRADSLRGEPRFRQVLDKLGIPR